MDFTYIQSTFSRLVSTILGFITLKGVWANIVKGLLFVGAYLAGIKLHLTVVFILVLLDVITGVWGAYNRGEKITSRKLRKGLLEKFILYFILIITSMVAGEMLQYIFGYEKYYIAGFVAFFIGLYEMRSIFENVVKINPDLKFLVAINSILEKFQNKKLKELDEKLNGEVIKEESNEETPSGT